MPWFLETKKAMMCLKNLFWLEVKVSMVNFFLFRPTFFFNSLPFSSFHSIKTTRPFFSTHCLPWPPAPSPSPSPPHHPLTFLTSKLGILKTTPYLTSLCGRNSSWGWLSVWPLWKGMWQAARWCRVLGHLDNCLGYNMVREVSYCIQWNIRQSDSFWVN